MPLSTFLNLPCNLEIPSRLDNTRVSSNVAIKRRVLTRRSWIGFSDTLARAFFQQSENSFHDLSNEDRSPSVRCIRPKIVPKLFTGWLHSGVPRLESNRHCAANGNERRWPQKA